VSERGGRDSRPGRCGRRRRNRRRHEGEAEGSRVDRGIGEEEGIGGRNSRAADAWLSLACVAAIAFQGGASVRRGCGAAGRFWWCAARDLGRGWGRERAESGFVGCCSLRRRPVSHQPSEVSARLAWRRHDASASLYRLPPNLVQLDRVRLRRSD